MDSRRNIYSECIDDVAMEISLSSAWRKRIFSLQKSEKITISAGDGDSLPEYIRCTIIENDLRFTVCIADDCEERFDEGLVVFRFASAEFEDITALSGNNPAVK